MGLLLGWPTFGRGGGCYFTRSLIASEVYGISFKRVIYIFVVKGVNVGLNMKIFDHNLAACFTLCAD